MWKYLLTLSSIVSLEASAGISRHNSVEWIAVSSIQAGNDNFVELQNPLENNECLSNNDTRIRFAKEDNNLLALLLAAKTANRKIGFYYKTTSSLTKTSGHGVPACEFQNVWLEVE